jgi:hypothetical protein
MFKNFDRFGHLYSRHACGLRAHRAPVKFFPDSIEGQRTPRIAGDAS